MILILFSASEFYECAASEHDMSVRDAVLHAQAQLGFDLLESGHVFVPALGLSLTMVSLQNNLRLISSLLNMRMN